MASESTCSLCNTEAEDTLHVMRDCPHARSVWHLVSQGYMTSQQFYTDGLDEWMMSNLQSRSSSNNIPWSIIFGAILVSIWHQRNEAIFSDISPSPSSLNVRIKRLAHDIIHSFSVDHALGTIPQTLLGARLLGGALLKVGSS